MSGEALTSYAELASIIDNLALIVREARRARGISQREAGRQMGVDNSFLFRLESGANVNSGTLSAVLGWLDATPTESGASA